MCKGQASIDALHRMGMLCLFVCIAHAVPATTQPPPPPTEDVLGIYSEPDHDSLDWRGSCWNPVSGPQEIYMVASGITDSVGIFGWECQVMVPEYLFFTGVDYLGDAVNAAVAPDFIVSLTQPLLDEDGAIHLATMSFFVVPGTCDVFLYLEPATQPSIPGKMTYASGADPGVLVPFAWSSGHPANPVFGFNANPLFPAVEPATWGLLKTLYR